VKEIGYGFLAGFVLAGALAVFYAANQDAKAALARVQHEASLAAARDSLHGFHERAQRLAVDSARLSISLAGARRARDAAQAENAALARRLAQQGDTAGARVVLAGDSTAAAERAACSLVALNCEARAAVADSARAVAVRQLDTTVALWRGAERRAQPSFFRDAWRARGVTLPLLAATVYLVLRK
jgi:hypothetical protein